MKWDRSSASTAPYRGEPSTGSGRTKDSKSFARKIDAERWLKVSVAEALTGQWLDPTAGAKLFGPHAEEWTAYKRSAVGETTATNIVAAGPGASGVRGQAVEEGHDPPDVRRWLGAMTEEGLSVSPTSRSVLLSWPVE